MTATTAEPSPFDQEFADSVRPDRLQLILLPTEQCNFRCTYCYEDFEIGRMAPEVVAGVKNLIDRRAAGLRHLQVSWFGGEPMLARAIVEEVAEHVRQAQRRHPELAYGSDMTTNGYLLDGRTAERLSGLGVRSYQVSLDGPDAFHDRTRVRADGRGTFEQIWRNLVEIREGSADLRMMLRVHLTPENLPAMPGFLTRVRDTFLDDPRFRVFLKRVVRLGGPNDATMEVIGRDERQIDELRALLTEGGGPERLFTAEQVCYAAKANSLLVRADGRLGKCTVALSDAANDIGRLRPDGSLEVDNPKLRPWLQGWAERDPELNGCPYSAFTSTRAPGRTQAAALPLLQIAARPPVPAPAG
ncbi:radical SAM protein [Kitasatospora sp. NPDC093806]|uniref:radical SAM protein n=1 Tax=Kitasatospora sp. NPDC093806 TaxID=3155075 RepID=UPI0034247F70